MLQKSFGFISLAKALQADQVLLDDRDARRELMRLGLGIAGTIGILERAAEKHFSNCLRCSRIAIRRGLGRQE
jgi:predicted nucleic acid-binding protein